MDSKAITGFIEKQDWLEPVAENLQSAVGKTFEAGGAAGQKAEDFLNGVWLGHALHPVLTDVPIGAWTVSTVLDTMEAVNGRSNLAAGADAAIAIGVVGALGAAATGLASWYPLHSSSARRVGVTHALLNVGATALFATSWLMRRRNNRPAGRALGFMGYAIVCASAYLGGSLVYEQKIGVNNAPQKTLSNTFLPVLPLAELAENEPRRVEVEGIKVLLVRRGDQIYALAETCSHLEGPLAEGRLEGDCIVCPLHGSRFALKDGSVQQGPATFPQPCFEARLREGQIELRTVQS